jgi:hypothetical protein
MKFLNTPFMLRKKITNIYSDLDYSLHNNYMKDTDSNFSKKKGLSRIEGHKILQIGGVNVEAAHRAS